MPTTKQVEWVEVGSITQGVKCRGRQLAPAGTSCRKLHRLTNSATLSYSTLLLWEDNYWPVRPQLANLPVEQTSTTSFPPGTFSATSFLSTRPPLFASTASPPTLFLS